MSRRKGRYSRRDMPSCNKLALPLAMSLSLWPNHPLINHHLTILERHPTQGSEVPAPAGDAAEKNRGRRKTYMTPSSSGRRPRCTCLSRPGLAPCRRHGYMLPKQSMRRYGANKEVLRRALAPPPNRKMTVRWWNFKPTPSRLSNMSMA
ncbi:hypothetical protein V6N13_049737 [Hibiscus sabdariffa]